jgi:hypothetical protein
MKHDWNSLENYLTIHEKILRFYNKWMDPPRTYRVEKLTQEGSDLILSCHSAFLTTEKGTRIRVDIEKIVEVDDTLPNRKKARTYSYSYSANIPGGDKLIRYCSPHEDGEEEGSAPHHKHHHKHDFTKKPEIKIIVLEADSWPHVGDFLKEVRETF